MAPLLAIGKCTARFGGAKLLSRPEDQMCRASAAHPSNGFHACQSTLCSKVAPKTPAHAANDGPRRTSQAIDAGEKAPSLGRGAWRSHRRRHARCYPSVVETDALQSDIAKSRKKWTGVWLFCKNAKRGVVDRALCSVAH